MKARVTVTLKSGVLDPQGKAIEGALRSLGINGVTSVRQGKVFDIELDGADKARAEAALKEAADKAASQEALKFFKYAFEKGGKMAEGLDYIPMPDSVVKQIEKTWSSEIKS